MITIFFYFIGYGILYFCLGDFLLEQIEQRLLNKRKIPNRFRLLVNFHLVLGLGYFSYWIFYLDHRIGVVYATILFIFCCVRLLYQLIKFGTLSFAKDRESHFQLLLIFLIACLYFAVLSISSGRGITKLEDVNCKGKYIAYLFSGKNTSSDYKIQWLYSQFELPWNIVLCAYKTTVSDRPPIIGGTTMMLRTPKTTLTMLKNTQAKIFPLSHDPFLGKAIFCCMVWIPLFWGIFRSFKIPICKCFIIIFIIACIPFVFWNTVYCWPKMPAGTFMCLGYMLADSRMGIRKKFGNWAIPFSALFVGFSLLGHLVNAIIIPFLGLILLLKHELSLKTTFIGITIVICILASWYLPKKIYETPHPSLFRYLSTDCTDKELFFGKQSDWEAIQISYKKIGGINDIFQMKKRLLWNSLKIQSHQNAVHLVTGYTLVCGFLIAFLLPCRKKGFFMLQKIYHFIVIFFAVYLIMLLLNYKWEICTPHFPTSVLLFCILSFATVTSSLNEKILAGLFCFALFFFLYLYCPYVIFVQLLFTCIIVAILLSIFVSINYSNSGRFLR